MVHAYMVQSSLSSVTFHKVIVLQCYFQYFNTLPAKNTKIKYQIKQSFIHEYQIWRSEIDNVLKKGEFVT